MRVVYTLFIPVSVQRRTYARPVSVKCVLAKPDATRTALTHTLKERHHKTNR